MMGFDYGHGIGLGWFFMLIGGVIVVALILLIIYALVRAANTSGNMSSSAYHESNDDRTGRALMILSERYAKGEIDEEEYRKKKSEITKP